MKTIFKSCNKAHKALFHGIRITLISTLIMILTSGCYFFPQEEEVLAPPLKASQEVTYKTVKVELGTIEKKIDATAYFISDAQTGVSFQYKGGRIAAIYVKTGDVVKAGDVLLQLDTESLENQLFQQQMSLERLKLNYNQTISSYERSIKLAELELENLKKKKEKLEATIAGIPDGISVQDILPGAEDQLQELEKQISRQEMNIQAEKEKYENSKALLELDIQTAELQLENIKSEIEKSKLIAPISGKIVWMSSIKEGDYVYTQQEIIRIADLSRLKLRYSGEYNIEFKLGVKVDVEINGGKYEGEVVMLPSMFPSDADESLKNSVLIEVKNLPKDVSLGDYARITYLIERKENVIVLPKHLVHGYMGQKTVYVLKDGIKEDRVVQIGIENPTKVEIVSGLEVGEEVIES